MTTKHFLLYVTAEIDLDTIPSIRKAVQKMSAEMLEAGDWVTSVRVDLRGVHGSDLSRLVVEVAGAKCANPSSARARLIKVAEEIKESGGSLFGLGFSHGTNDENIFEERPDLQARQVGEQAPDPISVRLMRAEQQLIEVTSTLDETRAELTRAAETRDAARKDHALALAERDAARADDHELRESLRVAREQLAGERDRIAAFERMIPRPGERG